MLEVSLIPKEASEMQTATFAGRSRKSNVLKDITTCSDVPRQKESSNTESRSFKTSSFQQIPKSLTHFGPHLLASLKQVRELKLTNSNLENRMSDEEPVKTLKKNIDLSCSSIPARSVPPKKVIPFCEELVTASQRSQSRSVSQFSSPYSPYEAMEQSTPHKGHFDWTKPMSPSSFSQDGSPRSDLQQCRPPWMKNQRQQPDGEPKPSEAAIQEFRTLGLSFDQILGLEYLGFHVSRFLPPAIVPCNHDRRIPPSFDLDGASCYWCESPQHIAYGVAFILKDDARVIGVEMEWSRSSENVALIQIATADIALLIPMSTASLSTPKALQIVFRDPEIVKTGVKIEKNLKALWLNFQIESSSFVELNELLEFSISRFRSLPAHSETPLNLQGIASALGYQSWQTQEMVFSNWDSRPLSWKQLRYAARNALVTIRIFWRIVLGRRVSEPMDTADLQVNIGQFVDSVCTRGPISKRHENVQVKPQGLSFELPSHLQQIITPIVCSIDNNTNDLFGVQDDRLSISPDIPPGLGEGYDKAFTTGHENNLTLCGGLYNLPTK